MFDYIIVGAGSAGCVLANRLSEDQSITVLLVEAGKPDKSSNIHTPAAFSETFKSDLDWEYYTDPEPHLNGRKLYWPRGKTLGGSSSINAMIYIRGHQADYEEWAQLGNEEWGWDDVLPYFKKSEHNERGAIGTHGTGGPLNVTDLQEVNPLSYAFVEAAVQAGNPRNLDFNGESQDGAGFYQVTQKDGQRWSTAKGYLVPALNRPNLTVYTEAQATRVTFNGTRANGLEFMRNGRRETIGARREVILCGGAINSPQLLMLSGIGPAEHLRALGIQVRMDLAGVGQNLIDHPAAGIHYFSKQPVSMASANNLKNIFRYITKKQGPFASNVGEAGLFVRSKPKLKQPDIQYHFAPLFFMSHNYGDIKADEAHGYTYGPCLVKPKSVGEICLRSADPTDYPAIRPNYLSHPDDMEAMLQGMKIGLNIGKSPALQPYLDRIYKPTPHQQSDEDLRVYLRNYVETLYHPVGTCKMGVDQLAVVNPQLQVHGVEGLRVVDASVMPTIVGGNTNAPTIMIAEKSADYIKAAI